ncbi:hypothetical protein ACWEVP_31635 [Amycolatopsis sp. NPDC003865]
MSTLDTTPQPRPLRVIAAVGALVSLIVGGLPTVGVPLDPAATGWLVGIVGAACSVAVALVGEGQVTPVSSPRAADGTPLVRATPGVPPPDGTPPVA